MSEDDESERRFTILYGSETGNAQDVAERIARQARRRRIVTNVQSMDEYDVIKLINESLVIFVISTTGNGDFPPSSFGFWKFLLRSNLPSDILCDLTYATFGLGDSSYVRYCWPSRKLNKRIRGLGAEELIEAGEADDQHYLGIEGALQPWLGKLWKTLDDILPPLRNGEVVIGDDELLPPSISIKVKDARVEGTSNQSNGKPAQKILLDDWKWAQLTRMERMTQSDHWQDVRLVELQSLDSKQMIYEAGDVVCLMPENSSEDVQRFLDRMGWTDVADLQLDIRMREPGHDLPPTLAANPHFTLRQLLQTYIDFNSVPRPSFFEQLIPFTPPDHLQREKLQEFCTPGDGSDDMYEYAIRVRRTILEVLEEFDSVKFPLTYLLDIIPSIRRREFSIASGPHHHTNSIQLAIAMVLYKTRLKEKRKGTCSSWLGRLQVGDRVPIKINKATTHLPKDPSTPAIFVGPGTGVAPIRSFLQERLHLLSQSEMKGTDNLCFFGCRNQSSDWLFSNEWDSMAKNGNICYRLAASRDQAKKVYVQHLIEEEASKVYDILFNRGGYIYVCGSSGKMPQAVWETVVRIISQEGRMSEEEAENFVTQLELKGRWLEECWS